MPPREHAYRATLHWTGAVGGALRDYASYSRELRVDIANKPPLTASADPAFRGDPALHNPEDLLLAALAGCHCLSFLALAARRGVAVSGYVDACEGVMRWGGDTYAFAEVVLRPSVTAPAGTDPALVEALHEEAHRLCFIARSVNFPVRHAGVLIAG